MNFTFRFTFYTPHSAGQLERTIYHTHFTTFRRILEALHTEWRNISPRFVSTPKRRNKNIKYFISPSGNGTHSLSCLQSHACAPAPQLAPIFKIIPPIYFDYKYFTIYYFENRRKVIANSKYVGFVINKIPTSYCLELGAYSYIGRFLCNTF